MFNGIVRYSIIHAEPSLSPSTGSSLVPSSSPTTVKEPLKTSQQVCQYVSPHGTGPSWFLVPPLLSESQSIFFLTVQPSTYPSLQPVIKFVSPPPTTANPTRAPTMKSRAPTSNPSTQPTLGTASSGASFVSIDPDKRRITHRPSNESETESDSAGPALRQARVCVIMGSALLVVLVR